MKVSLKISKYLGIFKRFSPKDRFFQLLQVRVPLQSILIFVYSESQITASSQGTGIVAGNPNQTRVHFWSGVHGATHCYGLSIELRRTDVRSVKLSSAS